MKKMFSIVFLLFSLANFGSCQNADNQSSGLLETISVDQFEKKLMELPAAQLIDVRTSEEYSGGHLKNSVNLNVNSPDFKDQVSKLDKTKPVFVYCLSGGRSLNAAKIMQSMGFKEVYNMDGGIMKWRNAGKSLEQGSTKPKSEGMSTDDFNKLVSVKNYVLVDYNAPWCAPCQKMLPFINSLVQSKKDKLTLVSINADDNKALLKSKAIDNIPYLELYRDGKLIWKHNGYIDEKQLLQETKL